jgi:hypothetical protein
LYFSGQRSFQGSKSEPAGTRTSIDQSREALCSGTCGDGQSGSERALGRTRHPGGTGPSGWDRPEWAGPARVGRTGPSGQNRADRAEPGRAGRTGPSGQDRAERAEPGRLGGAAVHAPQLHIRSRPRSSGCAVMAVCRPFCNIWSLAGETGCAVVAIGGTWGALVATWGALGGHRGALAAQGKQPSPRRRPSVVSAVTGYSTGHRSG